MPSTASERTATGGVGHMPITAIGSPHTTMPTPNGTARRERPTSDSVTTEPISPPTPIADVR